MSLRLSDSQRPSSTDFTKVMSDFNETTKQKIGPPAATVIVTSSGITAQEPQQNPVLFHNPHAKVSASTVRIILVLT